MATKPLANPSLNSAGNFAASNENWAKSCGEMYISSRTPGADFSVNLQIGVKSEVPAEREACFNAVESRRYTYGVHHSGNSLSELIGAKSWLAAAVDVPLHQNDGKFDNVKMLLAEQCPSIEITINVLKRGGTQTTMPNSIPVRYSDNNKYFAQVSCQKDEIQTCIEALGEINRFLFTGNDGNNLTAAFRDLPKSVDQSGGAAIVSYELSKPWMVPTALRPHGTVK